MVPGGKPIIFFPMLALLEPGDEVIYPNPGFPDLRIDDPLPGRDAGAHAARRERGFSFDLDLFREPPDATSTKMVVLNSPQNPTGGVIPRDGHAQPSPTCCATAT